MNILINNEHELVVPDILIDKFISDFEGLSGGKNYEDVCKIGRAHV